MTEREEFAEIPAALVEATKVRLAGAVCKLVARDLGLGPVEVRWLTPAHEAGYSAPREARLRTEDDFRGLVRSGWPGTIFLRVDIGPRSVVEIVAHECRHLWQAREHGDWVGWWRDCGHQAAREDDATAYAARFTRDLGW